MRYLPLPFVPIPAQMLAREKRMALRAPRNSKLVATFMPYPSTVPLHIAMARHTGEFPATYGRYLQKTGRFMRQI